MGSIKRASCFGHMETTGVGHTDLTGDYPIGPVRIFGDMETPPRV